MFANDGFKIRGWDETGLHVGSARRFGGSIGTLVTKDADMARKPAEVNVQVRTCVNGCILLLVTTFDYK